MISIEEKKRALNVTWDDPDTNAKIDEDFASAEILIKDYAGVELLDFDADGLARQLIKDCARYIWNDCLDEFERRYQTHLIALRNKYLVQEYDPDDPDDPEEDVKTEYLGHLSTIYDMSMTAKKGQRYVCDEELQRFFPDIHIHAGDELLCEKDNPERLIDGVNWTLLHNEPDTNTEYPEATAQDIADIFG